jgi:hypothetical protein
MADSPKNSPTTSKQNISSLKAHKVNTEVMIAILLHSFLFLCLIILLYLLAKQFNLV